VENIFGKLRIRAGLYRPERGSSQPRLHDLRHTSAVHRLVAWYRDGKDVRTLLPYLSTYLGHLNLSGTQCYLSMTPELLDEVNRRFEGYALGEVNHV
jgi:site-specific recombinase XerD